MAYTWPLTNIKLTPLHFETILNAHKDLICTYNMNSKAISLYTKLKGDKSTMYTKSKGDNPSTQSQKMITLTDLVSTGH